MTTIAKDINRHEKTGVTDSSVPGYALMVKHRLLILLATFGVCTLLYYFGQIADYFNWKALQWEFFYEIHDTHRLFFLVPIIYACYFFGIKEMVMVTAASLIVFLPRAILISPFPDSIYRAVFFAVFAGVLGWFIRISLNKMQRRKTVEAVIVNGGSDFAGAPPRIEDGIFTVRELEADLSRRVVKRRGKIVKLTPKEYELLSYLIRNAGKALGHAELLRNVWGTEYGQESEYLRTFVWQLRHKLEDDPSNPQFILTEPGVGYRFTEPERRKR